jgi:hypothetical protein
VHADRVCGRRDRDSVNGTAQHLGADAPYPVIEVSINARSRADGTHDRGRVVLSNLPPIRFPALSFSVPAT